jgi:hypothetical protein
MNIEDLTEQDIQSLLDEIRGKKETAPGADPVVQTQGQPAPTGTQEVPKFTIKIGDRDFTGTQEEIQTAINAEQRRLNQSEPPRQPERKVTVEEDNLEDLKAELAKRLEKNPVDAWKMMNERTLGVKDPAEFFRAATQAITEQSVRMAALEFRLNHPEWEPKQENVERLNSIMQQFNIPPTNLELAYRVFQASDSNKPAEPEPVPAAPKSTPPPRVSRNVAQPSGPSEEEALAELDSLSLEQLRELDLRLRSKRNR